MSALIKLILNENDIKKEKELIEKFKTHYPEYNHLVGNSDKYICFNHLVSTIGNYMKIVPYPQGYLNNKKKQGYIYCPYPDTDELPNFYVRIQNILYYHYDNKAESVVIDLRGNWGGMLYAFCFAILPLVSEYVIKFKSKEVKGEIKVKDGQFHWHTTETIIHSLALPYFRKIKFKKVSVIIDKTTASGGEFMTYILKKYLNATIYGSRSAGAITTMIENWFDGFRIVRPSGIFEDDLIIDHRLNPDEENIPEEIHP